jgi:hypothetical protein
MKELATPLSKMDIRITSTLITILDAMLETDTPDESVLLRRPYQPPPLFIFEEVELGSGYHTLHATHNHEEHGWSEPYKKSSQAEYRSRTVRVPYPPTAHPTDEEKASMARFGPESFRFTTGGVEYELAKYSPLGTVACTEEDLIACLAAIPDERLVLMLNRALAETWAIFFCYPDGDGHQTFELVRAYNSRDAAERSLAARVRGCPGLIDGAEDTYPVHVSARSEFEEGARGKHFWLIERLDVQT